MKVQFTLQHIPKVTEPENYTIYIDDCVINAAKRFAEPSLKRAAESKFVREYTEEKIRKTLDNPTLWRISWMEWHRNSKDTYQGEAYVELF